MCDNHEKVHIMSDSDDESDDESLVYNKLLVYNKSNDITIIEQFLLRANINIKLKKICALTVQIDRSSLCGTFIFDYDKRIMLKHYPGRYSNSPIQPIYKTFDNINWTINLVTNLLPKTETGVLSKTPEISEYYPFCCNNCKSEYKRLPFKWENIFDDFKNKKSSNNYTFRVVKKIQHGDLLYIKYFKIVNNKITEDVLCETEHKLNTFKIYTCNTHNTYYSLNLMTSENTYNKHHAKLQNETEYGPQIISKMM